MYRKFFLISCVAVIAIYILSVDCAARFTACYVQFKSFL